MTRRRLSAVMDLSSRSRFGRARLALELHSRFNYSAYQTRESHVSLSPLLTYLVHWPFSSSFQPKRVVPFRTSELVLLAKIQLQLQGSFIGGKAIGVYRYLSRKLDLTGL